MKRRSQLWGCRGVGLATSNYYAHIKGLSGPQTSTSRRDAARQTSAPWEAMLVPGIDNRLFIFQRLTLPESCMVVLHRLLVPETSVESLLCASSGSLMGFRVSGSGYCPYTDFGFHKRAGPITEASPYTASFFQTK